MAQHRIYGYASLTLDYILGLSAANETFDDDGVTNVPGSECNFYIKLCR